MSKETYYFKNKVTGSFILIVEWFCEDPQDLLELTPKKDVLSLLDCAFLEGRYHISLQLCILVTYLLPGM